MLIEGALDETIDLGQIQVDEGYVFQGWKVISGQFDCTDNLFTFGTEI